MREIKCLYLEHKKDKFDKCAAHLRACWKARIGGNLVIDNVTNLEEAIERLEFPEGTYQLFISDILFPPVPTPEEPDVARHLPMFEPIKIASTKSKLLVIGLSIGDRDRFPRLAEQMMDAGAHLAKYTLEVFPNTEPFCEEVYKLLVQKGIVQDPTPLKYDDRDARLCSIVHEIGETTLKSLYKQIFLHGDTGIDSIKLEYLVPGMSGALVLRVKVQQDKIPPRTHLLKVSTNRRRLSNEVERCPNDGPYSAGLVVSYLGPPVQVGEWYAIGAGFQKDTKPFKAWLAEGHTKREIEGVLGHLVLGGGLIRGYNTDLNDEHHPRCAVESLMPNALRTARILQAIDEFREVIVAPSLAGLDDWSDREEILTAYLRSQQVGTRDAASTPRSCFLCQCHGDLHSRNILVTKRAPAVPIIIDWADLDICHWASDCARLLVDLVLAVYDSGVASHEWKHLSQWRDIAQKVIAGDTIPQVSDPGNDSVVRAVNWILDNLQSICPAIKQSGGREKSWWEFQLALAVEFMRGAYRPDLQAPKRTLALVAASDAILAIKETMPVD